MGRDKPHEKRWRLSVRRVGGKIQACLSSSPNPILIAGKRLIISWSPPRRPFRNGGDDHATSN